MFKPLPLEGYEFAGTPHFYWPMPDGMPNRSEGRIAIVGLPNAGKKTLVNSLWGWPALKATPESSSVRKLGLFTLVTPPDESDDDTSAIYHLESADLVIYLIDGLAGAQEHDIRWLARLRVLPGTLLIVMNKADQITDDLTPARISKLEDMFARPVITLTASDQQMVHDRFLPLVLKTCPQLTIPLAAEITGLRWKVSRQVIRDAAVHSSLVSLENGAVLDLPALLDLQRRLVRQIAHIYGYGEQDDPQPAQWPRLVQRGVSHYGPRVMDLLGPRGQHIVSSLVAFAGTWLLGYRTQAKYDADAPLNRLSSLLSPNGNHD